MNKRLKAKRLKIKVLKTRYKIEMKFAHLADCHLGAWKRPELQRLSMKAFEIAIDKCIAEKVNFVIIAGDLFEVAMPGIDILKETVSIIKKLKQNNIKCFLLAGSHDFSITGKTFLDVLERADLFKNIFIINQREKVENAEGNEIKQIELELEMFYDKELKVAITGLPGKKAGVEVNLFKNLKIKNIGEDDKNDKNFLKIFVFHTTLIESKPEEMKFVDSIDLNALPEDFDYYAGGHLHLVAKHKKGRAFVTYPGPLFPNNFEELEKLKYGQFFIVEIDEKNKETKIKEEEIRLKDVVSIISHVDFLTPSAATEKILSDIEKQNIKDKLVLLKICGTLNSGKTSDINFEKIKEKLQESYCYLKNTSALSTKEFKINVENKGEDIETIEKNIIMDYVKTEQTFKEFLPLMSQLNVILNTEKYEGETKEKYETRILEEFKKIIKEME